MNSTKKNHTLFNPLALLAVAAFSVHLLAGCEPASQATTSPDETSLRQKGGAQATSADTLKPAGAGVVKVDICHIPPGNPGNAHIIRVGSPAYPAHMAHGDKSCNEIGVPTDGPDTVSLPNVTPPPVTSDSIDPNW